MRMERYPKFTIEKVVRRFLLFDQYAMSIMYIFPVKIIKQLKKKIMTLKTASSPPHTQHIRERQIAVRCIKGSSVAKIVIKVRK